VVFTLEALKDFTDQWVFRDGCIHAEGDFDRINKLLSHLTELRRADGGWRVLYVDELRGSYWELSYPQAEMHGGGPRRLKELAISTPSKWQ
jgi:hypothetical protein